LDVLAPLEACRQDRRITTSRLLPRILELKDRGWNYRRIGGELGVTKRAVEHVVARHRKSAR
jgi:orotate phosphoribosyltransferase-like protein